MKKSKSPYRILRSLNAIMMILALVWLTVSAPFVNAANLELQGVEFQSELVDMADADDHKANPFGNNTEEKAHNSAGFNEEYLHHTEDLLHADQLNLQHFRALASREYVAFHGELLCPPPNNLA